MSPPDLSQDRGIARRCKLFLGTELGRGTLVQEDLFVWPSWNAAENSQRQTCKLSHTLSLSNTGRVSLAKDAKMRHPAIRISRNSMPLLSLEVQAHD